MELNQNTANIIAALGGPLIDENRRNTQNWGVLFNTYQNADGTVGDEAWGIADTMICRWSEYGELTYDKEAPYYVIEENLFMRSQVGITPQALHEQMAKLKFDQIIRVPVGNLYNMICDEFPTKKDINSDRSKDRDRVRVVLKANMGEVQPGLILLQAHKDESGQVYLKHPSLDKRFLVGNISRITANYLEHSRIYQCSILEDIDEHTSAVNVKFKFFKGIEFLAHNSTNGYFPDDNIENSTAYSDLRKLQVPFFIDNVIYDFEPIHLSANLLVSVLNILRGFEWMHVHVNRDARAPLLFVGEKSGPTYPLIQIAIQPLDKSVRGDIL